MKVQKHLMLVVLALVATLLLCAVPVAARAVKTEFKGTWTVIGLGAPEKIWYPDDGRMQARGWPLWVNVGTEDDRVDGEWTFVFDDHFDSQLAGPWNGTFHGEIQCGEDKGTWEGSFTGECYGGAGADGGIIYAVGQGSGCVEGQKIFFDALNRGDGGDRPFEGYILNPHG